MKRSTTSLLWYFLGMVALVFTTTQASFNDELFQPSMAQENPSITSDQNSASADFNGGSNDFPAEQQPLAGNCVAASTILRLIAPSPGTPIRPIINLPAILQENIYRRTNPITIRSLLDLPSLQSYYFDNDDWSVSIQPFYNQTSRVYFTKCTPFIKSYIDLTNKNIINELESALQADSIQDQVPAALRGNIPTILGLFTNISLQQRRSGIMLGVYKEWNRLNVNLFIPLYYLENNFFLSQEEQDRISSNPFFGTQNIGSANSNEEEVQQYFIRHLLSDRLGVGDTRLNGMINIYDTCNTTVWVGIEATLPTASAFSKGILGGEFNQNPMQPPFNIKRIFNLSPLCFRDDAAQERANAELFTLAQDFLLNTLDRLSTILLNTPLGNYKSTGIGPRLDVKYYFNDYLSMHTVAEYEYFTKHRQRRFFLVEKNPIEFMRNYQNPDPVKEELNLEFLNRQIIDTFFPESTLVEVRPGALFKWRHSVIYDTKHWHASLGFDYWHQQAEHVGSISDKLAKKRGLKSNAYQGKLFGTAGYYGSSFCHRIAWNILFTGDFTLFSKAIGKDFTLGLRFGIDF